MKKLLSITSLLCLLATSAYAQTTLQIDDADFGITNSFNEVNLFQFNIDLSSNLVAGQNYVAPAISQIDYRIDGDLTAMGSPSGFPGFSLIRNYTGDQFYAQSPDASLQFEIDSAADLSDGLQLSELVSNGSDPILFFNARELNQNPGRYHPPVLSLFADGTGLLQNANNQSTILNPDSNELVNVDLGEEYIVNLSFNPANVTIAGPAAVPEPTGVALLGLGSIIVLLRRRR